MKVGILSRRGSIKVLCEGAHGIRRCMGTEVSSVRKTTFTGKGTGNPSRILRSLEGQCVMDQICSRGWGFRGV